MILSEEAHVSEMLTTNTKDIRVNLCVKSGSTVGAPCSWLLLFLIRTPRFLSGMWFGVASRADTENTCLKELRFFA